MSELRRTREHARQPLPAEPPEQARSPSGRQRRPLLTPCNAASGTFRVAHVADEAAQRRRARHHRTRPVRTERAGDRPVRHPAAHWRTPVRRGPFAAHPRAEGERLPPSAPSAATSTTNWHGAPSRSIRKVPEPAKGPTCYNARRPKVGGGGGIRTHETGGQSAGVQRRCIQPLCHTSLVREVPIRGRRRRRVSGVRRRPLLRVLALAGARLTDQGWRLSSFPPPFRVRASAQHSALRGRAKAGRRRRLRDSRHSPRRLRAIR